MQRQFTESEKLVIYGLAQDANRTDSSLASRYGLKLSTVTSVRRRLMDLGHIPFANFPSFHKLGCEIIVQLYGPTNPGVPRDIKDQSHLSYLDETPEVFDSMSTEGFIWMSGAFRSFSDYLLALDRYKIHFDGVRAAEKANLRAAYFPLRISGICYSYNYAPGLHRMFNLDLPKPKPNKPAHYEVENVGLSSMEKLVLLKLVEYPNATDPEIAKLIGRSRQTIFNVRKRLEKKGMFRRVCSPYLLSWNIDFIAYVHYHLKPNMDAETKAFLFEEDWMNLSWYILERRSEVFAAYMFKSYSDYVSEMQRMMKPLIESGVLERDPDISLVSTGASRDLRDGSFAPMMRKFLDIRDEDASRT